MTCRVLIVEDEIFVAIEVESVVRDLGHLPVGIAADSVQAMQMGHEIDIALVDLNLYDGPTGLEVGRRLARNGATVMFMTANPIQLGDGVPGALGVLPKPANNHELRAAIAYVVAVHRREHARLEPPHRFRLFADSNSYLAMQPTG